MVQVVRPSDPSEELGAPSLDSVVDGRVDARVVIDQSGGLDESDPRSEQVGDLVRRLSRIEGQIRGIKRMIQDGRDCRDLVTQFAAVSRALEQAALNYVTSELVWCVERPEEAAEHGYTVDELRKLLGRLR